uniref:Uncharacterized protein n=1 Tax=Steinernema glaseri TaxID=37863 RepID=A0A1I7Z5K8_9BILA
MATTPTSEKEKEPRSPTVAASQLITNAPTSPANFGVNLPAAANVFIGSTMDNVEGLLRLTTADSRQVRSRTRPNPAAPFVPMTDRGPQKFSYELRNESKRRQGDTPRPPMVRKQSECSVTTGVEPLSLVTAADSSHVSTGHSTLPDFDDTSVGSSPLRPTSSGSPSLHTAVRTPSSTCTAVSPTPSEHRVKTLRRSIGGSSPLNSHRSRIDQPPKYPAKSPVGAQKSSQSPFPKSSGYPTAKSPGVSIRTARSPMPRSSGYPTARMPSEASRRSQKSSGYPTAVSPLPKSADTEPLSDPATPCNSPHGPLASETSIKKKQTPPTQKLLRAQKIQAEALAKEAVSKAAAIRAARSRSPGGPLAEAMATGRENSLRSALSGEALATGREKSLKEIRSHADSLRTGRSLSPIEFMETGREKSLQEAPTDCVSTGREATATGRSPSKVSAKAPKSPAGVLRTGRCLSPAEALATARAVSEASMKGSKSPARGLSTGREKSFKEQQSPGSSNSLSEGFNTLVAGVNTGRSQSPALATGRAHSQTSLKEVKSLRTGRAVSPADALATGHEASFKEAYPRNTLHTAREKSPADALRTGRSLSPAEALRTGRSLSPGEALATGREASLKEQQSPGVNTGRSQSPALATGRINSLSSLKGTKSPGALRTGRALSPAEALATGHEASFKETHLRDTLHTAREKSPAQALRTGRSVSPAEALLTGRAAQSPAVRTGRSPSPAPPCLPNAPSGYHTAKHPSMKSPKTPSCSTGRQNSFKSPAALRTGRSLSPAVATGRARSETNAAEALQSPSQRSSGYPTAKSPSERSSGYPTAKSPHTSEKSLRTGRSVQSVATGRSPSPMSPAGMGHPRHSMSPIEVVVTGRALSEASLKTDLLSARSPSQKSSGYPTAVSPSNCSTARSLSPSIAVEPTIPNTGLKKSPVLIHGPAPAVHVVRKPSITSDQEFVAPKTSEIFDTRHPTRLSRGSPVSTRSEVDAGISSAHIPPKADGTYEMTLLCETSTPGQKVRIRINLESLIADQPGLRGREKPLIPQELAINNVTVWKK